MASKDDIFGEVIHTYSRAEAIEDEVLYDLSARAGDVVRQHYKYPLACTASVWGFIEEALKSPHQDLKGIVHDLCFMSRAMKTKTIDPTTHEFQVKIGKAVRTLKIVCGPGDDAAPVLTVMLPEED